MFETGEGVEHTVAENTVAEPQPGASSVSATRRVAALVLALLALGALDQRYADTVAVDGAGARPAAANRSAPIAPDHRPADSSTTRGIEPTPTNEAAALLEPNGRIDVNRANAADLELLPKVGPVLARRIVDDRERRGPFKSVRDLQRVKGLGPKTVAKLGRLIAIELPDAGPSLAPDP